MPCKWLVGARGVFLGRSLSCTNEHRELKQWSEILLKNLERMATDANNGAIVKGMLFRYRF